MAFLPTVQIRSHARGAVRARLHASSSGRLGDRRRLNFVLSPALTEQLGWQIGDRFDVAIGADEDLGAFRISRAIKPGQGVKLIRNTNSTGARLHLTLPPELHSMRPAEMIDLSALPIDFDVTVTGGRLDLTTPPGLCWIHASRPPVVLAAVAK